MSNFDDDIKLVFLEEAHQTLEEVEGVMIQLESPQSTLRPIEEIFRLAHSFKGSAAAVGFDHMARFAHAFEDALAAIKRSHQVPRREVITILLNSIDHLRATVRGLRQDLNFKLDCSLLISQLEKISTGEDREASQKLPETFEDLLHQKPSTEAKVNGPSQNRADGESIRVSMSKLDTLINIVGELVVNQSVMVNHKQHQSTGSDHAIQTIGYMEKLVGEIQDIAMSLRMVPIRPLFQKMNRIVRDVAVAQAKTVKFVTIGEDVELDKIVLERITDPLTHLIRNAIDHGLESSEGRVAVGKPTECTIELSAVQREDRIEVIVRDDGKGIDANKIRQKAIARNLLAPDAQISDDEVMNFIFQNGFSTRDQVTDLSGRGVGLDVVRKATTDLKGSISIETKPGQGTAFRISLPLSLSIISGMVVSIEEQKYILPISQLLEIVEYQKLVIGSHGGRNRMVELRGEVIPVYSLVELLHGPGSGRANQPRRPGIITEVNGKKISFEVDEILGQQQVVIKRLGNEIEGLQGVLGGAILSNGEPSLILDLNEFNVTRGAHAG